MEIKKRIPLRLGSLLTNAKDSSTEAQVVWYRTMHETMPVRYQPDYDLWEVFRYDDVQRVLTDYSTFSAQVLLEGFSDVGGLNILQCDPPDHRRYRTIAGKAFTARRVALLEPRITAIVDEILELGSAEGKLDIVEQLAHPLLARVIAEMLGVPGEDQERFSLWAYQLLGLLPKTEHSTGTELNDYFSDLLAARKKEPQNDLISALLDAEINGESLTAEEVLHMCVLLLVAGNVTTTILLSVAVRRFIQQPEMYQQLRADPSLIPGALEEILRYDFAHVNFMRTARHDTTIGEHEIKEGQTMMAWLSAANFDEAYFPHADQFDIRRSPNPHITFGHGIHFCLGAPLARLESKIVLERMIARWSDIRADPERPVQYLNPKIELIKSLPTLLT